MRITALKVKDVACISFSSSQIITSVFFTFYFATLSFSPPPRHKPPADCMLTSLEGPGGTVPEDYANIMHAKQQHSQWDAEPEKVTSMISAQAA